MDMLSIVLIMAIPIVFSIKVCSACIKYVGESENRVRQELKDIKKPVHGCSKPSVEIRITDMEEFKDKITNLQNQINSLTIER